MKLFAVCMALFGFSREVFQVETADLPPRHLHRLIISAICSSYALHATLWTPLTSLLHRAGIFSLPASTAAKHEHILDVCFLFCNPSATYKHSHKHAAQVLVRLWLVLY